MSEASAASVDIHLNQYIFVADDFCTFFVGTIFVCGAQMAQTDDDQYFIQSRLCRRYMHFFFFFTDAIVDFLKVISSVTATKQKP